jgi:hypothetical protein
VGVPAALERMRVRSAQPSSSLSRAAGQCLRNWQNEAGRPAARAGTECDRTAVWAEFDAVASVVLQARARRIGRATPEERIGVAACHWGALVDQKSRDGRILVAFAAVLWLAACQNSSSDERCLSIPPGTPLSSLGVTQPTHGWACNGTQSNPQGDVLACCFFQPDAGADVCGADCAAVPSFDYTGVGGDYAGGSCSQAGSWSCNAWYRDGGVIATWACCND